MKRDTEAKYLGNWICQAGLEHSVAYTASKRKPGVIASIRDVRTVVDDLRSKVCGGLVAVLQIWEMAILPGLLCNSECWIGMSKLNSNELIGVSSSYKKIHYSNEENFRLKSYISELDVSAARMQLKISTNMVPTIQMNVQSDPMFSANLWTCSGCSILRDTQDHVLKWPAYSDIRIGLNLEEDPDLVKYFQKIIQFRCNLDCMQICCL